MTKYHRRSGKYDRQVDTTQPKDVVLIVCEGTKTEPNYFNAFQTDAIISGTGRSNITLVECAIHLRNELQSKSHSRVKIETWVVFDRDSFTPDSISKAFEAALQNDIMTCFSNECFELWFVLHFEYLDSQLSRDQLKGKMDKLLLSDISIGYQKRSIHMYGILHNRQTDALRNAQKLLNW